jgi:hypothetical protein
VTGTAARVKLVSTATWPRYCVAMIALMSVVFGAVRVLSFGTTQDKLSMTVDPIKLFNRAET